MKKIKLIFWALFILVVTAGSTAHPPQPGRLTGVGTLAKENPPAQPGCVHHQQAGLHDFIFKDGSEIIVIQYPKPFCQIPIPMAVGSEPVDTVRIGVVTPSILSLIVDGTPGESGVIYWQVQEPTSIK